MLSVRTFSVFLPSLIKSSFVCARPRAAWKPRSSVHGKTVFMSAQLIKARRRRRRGLAPVICLGTAMTRKVLLLTGDGGDSYETFYAYQRFLEAHWEPVIAAPSRRRLNLLIHDREPGWTTYMERPGLSMDADVAITAVAAKEFAALVIVGGRAPEYLRNDPSVLSLVREFARQNKCICAIGHGAQLLTADGL